MNWKWDELVQLSRVRCNERTVLRRKLQNTVQEQTGCFLMGFKQGAARQQQSEDPGILSNRSPRMSTPSPASKSTPARHELSRSGLRQGRTHFPGAGQPRIRQSQSVGLSFQDWPVSGHKESDIRFTPTGDRTPHPYLTNTLSISRIINYFRARWNIASPDSCKPPPRRICSNFEKACGKTRGQS